MEQDVFRKDEEMLLKHIRVSGYCDCVQSLWTCLMAGAEGYGGLLFSS